MIRDKKIYNRAENEKMVDVLKSECCWRVNFNKFEFKQKLK